MLPGHHVGTDGGDHARIDVSGGRTLIEAVGGVFPYAGLALGVSHLLATMVAGIVVANLARHHRRPFRAIGGIEWPFMAIFFVLSDAFRPTSLRAWTTPSGSAEIPWLCVDVRPRSRKTLPARSPRHR